MRSPDGSGSWGFGLGGSQATQLLVKASQQLRDKADILIREAEALLFERQRALREAIARRKAKPAQSAIFNALYTV